MNDFNAISCESVIDDEYRASLFLHFKLLRQSPDLFVCYI
uniref:Uncharacterized protein n=1 Tax=Raoultella planticola TaxID=575 RepID=W8CUH3_RAOPL|nr:hypothetical protein pKpNDM1_00041 [Raoultella planticola]QZX60272.1 hypothetical protein [Klebsiella michiganensis]UGK55163.1 Hypothetical protein [Raoultella ornithinolytica]UWX38277.1 hypothetical protein KJK04_p1365 [Klebsiella quasipneumoniae]UWX38715.1 hypothetical protein KK467_p2035 [Klebsiella pneumoniae]